MIGSGLRNVFRGIDPGFESGIGVQDSVFRFYLGLRTGVGLMDSGLMYEYGILVLNTVSNPGGSCPVSKKKVFRTVIFTPGSGPKFGFGIRIPDWFSEPLYDPQVRAIMSGS